MNDNIDFKNLWQQTIIETPSVDDLIQKANRFKRKAFAKVFFINVIMVTISTLIICIWIYFQPNYLSTKIGIVLTLLAMFIFVGAYNSILPFLKTTNKVNNSTYLKELIKLKKKQQFLHSTIINTYFVMLSLGICLYLFEYVSRMSFTSGVLVYGITLSWFGINWFFFRPKTIKKQQVEINGLIDKFTQLEKQLHS